MTIPTDTISTPITATTVTFDYDRKNAQAAHGFVVICQDGAVRHAGRFANRAEAHTFAEWGHVCTNRHRITEVGR